MERYRSIQVRQLTLGDGIPKICVPIVAETEEGVQKEAERICGLPADLVEWRLDYLSDPSQAVEMLPKLRAVLGELPLLVTFRTASEGGEKELEPENYERLYMQLLDTGCADLLDVELFAGERTVRRLVEAARERGCLTVMSSHEFSHTPDERQMLQRLCCMQALGADITKLAVMPRSFEDVTRLLSVSAAMRDKYADRPYITMSRGEKGLASRVCGALTGSAVTFGSASRASAPGQMKAEDLARVLTLMGSRRGKNIYLIGFMGTGKSTVSDALAERTGMREIEMDEEIVRREGKPIAEIFADEGEAYFRTAETALLSDLGKQSGCLVSCGGGVPMREENVQLMKQTGHVVLLTARPATVLERVKGSSERPILNGNMNEAYIRTLMEKRREAYERAADIRVDTDYRSVEEICGEILERLSL